MTEKRDQVLAGAHQAVGQAKEIGRLARSDDPRHWRALAACTLAIVATAIDPPILQATSSGVQGALHVAPELAATVVGLYYVIQAGFMAAGVIALVAAIILFSLRLPREQRDGSSFETE